MSPWEEAFHFMSVCVPECETWRWFSKPSRVTAAGRGVLQSDTHIHQSGCSGASGQAVKHSATDLLGFQTGAQERPQQKPVYTAPVFLVTQGGHQTSLHH